MRAPLTYRSLMVLALFAAASVPAVGQEPWVSLFDGKSLNGWESRPTSDPASKGDWTVANGALVCGGTMPSWLATVKEFGNYRLTLEFRGAGTVNSGVFLRSQKEGQPHVTGYELQIWDYQPAGYLTGSLVGSLKADAAKILPDAWNRFDVSAVGDQFRVALNGKTILDARDQKHRSGVVGLQCQKDQPIEFRNIRLQPVNP